MGGPPKDLGGFLHHEGGDLGSREGKKVSNRILSRISI